VTNNKKAIILSVIGVFVFVASIVATSYAYFAGTVSKTNTDQNSTKATSTNIKATFTDGAQLTATNMIPGDSFNKTFSLKNTGNKSIKYKIVINNVSNPFKTPSDITLTLKEGTETKNTTTFPTATTAISGELTIDPGITKSYTLTITYKNTTSDQSADMGKTISGKIFIEAV